MNAGQHEGLTTTMTWQQQREAGATRLRLSGALTGEADFDAVLEGIEDGPVAIDLSGVTRVNSIGVRHWVDFITRLCEQHEVKLEDCSPAFVEQLMLIERMHGDATVASIQLPFLCERCDHDYSVTLALTPGVQLPGAAPCPRCGEPSELDDLPQRYAPLLARLS